MQHLIPKIMHPGTHKTGKNGKYQTGFVALLCLLGFLFVMSPKRASAQSCPPGGCSSLVEQLSMDAKSVAQFTWQIADSALHHLQSAALSFTVAMSSFAQTSALYDLGTARDSNADRRAQGGDAAKHGGELPATPTTYCNTQQVAGGQQGAALSASAVAGGLAAGGVHHSMQGDGAPVMAAQLTDEISHGFRDCSSAGPYGNLFQNLPGCTSSPTVNNESFIDADVMLNSVIGYDQYNVPAKTAIVTTTGSTTAAISDLKLPTLQNLSSGPLGNAEEHFIAAYYYCQRWRPHMPVPPRGNGRTMTTGDLIVEQGLDLAAKSNGPYEICLNALARRTAVSQAMGSGQGGGQFQQMYNYQYQACTQMHQMGYMTDCEYDGSNCTSTSTSSGNLPIGNCKTNGMSQVALQRHAAYRFGQENYLNFLVAHKQVNAEQLSMLQETEQYTAIQNFENGLTAEKIGVATALNGELNMPTGPQVNPASQPVGQ